MILNLIVAVSVLVVLMIVARRIVWNRQVGFVIVVLFFTTAVFDSLIITSTIVDYNADLITGVRIGAAPIEDFFYALVVALLVPTVWTSLRKDSNAND